MERWRGSYATVAAGRLFGATRARAAAALILALVSTAPALAADQCTIPDLALALGDTVSTVESGQCAAANSNSSLWILVLGLAAAVAAADGPGQQVCTEIKNILGSSVSDAQKVSSIAKQLGNGTLDLGDALQQGLQDVAQDLGDAANYIDIPACACSMEAALSQDVAVAGSCVQDVLCDVGKLDGQPCTCKPVAGITANCGAASAVCGSFNAPPNDPACANIIVQGPPGQSYTPVNITTGALGVLVTQGGDSQDANGNCSAVISCFCPKPMVLTPVNYNPQNEGGGPFTMYICQCPVGTSPPSNETGPVSSTCVCNNGPDAGKAVPPSGVCAPVCKSKTQVPVADGSCCNPSQVAACGECCAAGSVPDAATGQCKLLYTPTRPPPRL